MWAQKLFLTSYDRAHIFILTSRSYSLSKDQEMYQEREVGSVSILFLIILVVDLALIMKNEISSITACRLLSNAVIKEEIIFIFH